MSLHISFSSFENIRTSELLQELFKKMSFKFIFATAIVLSTVYSAYCQTSQNSCSGPVCGSDGITYSNRQAFCAAKGNDATAFIVKTGACCDCRDLCYTNLTRAYNRETKKHIATARTTLPSGFTAEKVWRLPCASTPNTRTLYECEYLGGSFLSFDPACESKVF